MKHNNKKLPRIDARDFNLVRVTEAAWQALKAANKPPFVFRYGDSLALIGPDENGASVVRLMNETGLRHVLARIAQWYKVTRMGEVDALPPMHVIKDMLVQSDGHLPVLARIVETPVFASDGSLHVTAGYNAASRCYCAPTTGLKIRRVSPRPSPAEVSRAVKLITENLLGDFPFIGDAERANAVS